MLSNHEIAILHEHAIDKQRALREANVVGHIAPPDPGDVICLSGYAAEHGYDVDEVWTRSGVTHAALSPRNRSAFDPPDVTIVRYDRATATVEECAWVNGAICGEFRPEYLDPICGVCRRHHPDDDRHACE